MQKVFYGLSVVILTICVIMVSACAFGNRRVNLTYTEVNVAPNQAQPGQEIIVNKFLDQRSNRQYIGEVKNGYGMTTAHVIANNDVSEWVSNALVVELERAGYKVIKGINQKDPVRLIVSGTITRAYCEMYMTQRAEIITTIQLTSRGQVVLNRTYTGEGKITAWSASAKSYEKVFNMALQDLMRKIIPDIINAMNMVS